jgi:predicted metal-dependent peptidase
MSKVISHESPDETAHESEQEQLSLMGLKRLTSAEDALYIRLPYLREYAGLLEFSVIPERVSRDGRDDHRRRRLLSHDLGLAMSVEEIASRGDDELIWLIAHEYIHLVWGHAKRGRDRNAQLWELASDHETNHILIEAGFSPAEGATYFPKLKGRSAEVVYNALLQKSNKDTCSTSKNTSAAFHSWSELREKQESIGETLSQAEVTEGSPKAHQSRIGQRNHQQCGIRSNRHRRRSYGTTERCRQIDLSLEGDMIQKKDWRSILTRFMRRRGSRYSVTRFRRRDISRGFYLPSMRGKLPHLVIALDTSGSTLNLLPSFLEELKQILNVCHRFKLTLIQCGASITSVAKLDHYQRNTITNVPLIGGGGTAFQPVFDYVETDEQSPPDLLIYLTDGCGPQVVTRPSYPVIWVLSEGVPPASFGLSLPLKQT